MWHQIIKIKFACIGALAITSNLHGQVIRLDRLPEVSHTETASLRRLQDVPWEHLNSDAPSLAARSQSAESAKAWWEPYVGQSLLPRPSVSAAFFSPDRTSVATLRLEPRPLASNPDTIDWLSLVRERWQAFGDERLTRTLRRHETAATQHDEYWELYVARCELLIHRRRYNKHLLWWRQVDQT